MKTHVIINPASGGGKTVAMLSHIPAIIKKYFGNNYSLYVTQKSLDAERSARAAVTDGANLVLAVGGDGTIHEIVNGLFLNRNLMNEECELGIISTGTGRGFAQSIGIPQSVEEQMRVVVEGNSRPVDIGKVTYQSTRGEEKERFFVNECQVGIGAEVVRRTQAHHKRHGGLLAYGFGTLSVLLQYPDQLMTVELDEVKTITGKLAGVVIGNGARTAGGMRLTPDAALDDGMFDVLRIREQSVLKRLRNVPRIYAGRHIHSADFGYCKARRISISSPEHVAVSADGEVLGVLPCTIELLPAALRIRCRHIPQEAIHANNNGQFAESRV